jgi:hypothetical protein
MDMKRMCFCGEAAAFARVFRCSLAVESGGAPNFAGCFCRRATATLMPAVGDGVSFLT